MTFIKDEWICRAILSGAYMVDAEGRIYRRKNATKKHPPRWVLQEFSVNAKNDRLYFNMEHEGIRKSVLVNRVVALIRVKNPNPALFDEVNHDDGDVQNNHPKNLIWASRSQQEKHAFKNGLKANRGSSNSNAKLKVEDVLAIRKTPEAIDRHALRLRVTHKTIKNIIERKTWQHV